MSSIPTLILGGTGYVAGELLRLLAQHPHFEISGVMSASQAGTPIGDVFRHLQGPVSQQPLRPQADLLDMLDGEPTALFSAAPHGASAALVKEFVERAWSTSTPLSVVDVSADFRYTRAEDYTAVYGQEHGAPKLLSEFVSALPEHLAAAAQPHIGHPGCFATALLLAAVPLMAQKVSDGDLHAVGITGSTGSGRSPAATTHHPERHANLFAYKPLAHRHTPEVVSLCAAVTGQRPRLHFVPHSGPFARGIHMTVQTRMASPVSTEQLLELFKDSYADAEFVRVVDDMPRLKDVVGSNYAHIGVTAHDDVTAVMVVIDNLIKGAAGGAIQWMNRQFALPESTGLSAPALGWS